MGASGEVDTGKLATTVLHVGGLNWASEKAVVEGVLGRGPGVGLVEANPVSQTATVSFDTAQASLAGLRSCVEECGYHSVGQSVPSYVCDPTAEPDPVDGGTATAAAPAEGGSPEVTAAAPGHKEHPPRPAPGVGEPTAGAGEMPVGHDGHEMAAAPGAPSAHEMMGHGGAAGMSMDAMVRDMRDRFLVAAIFSVPILLWSPIGRNVLGFTTAAPFGLRDDIWLLLLSLPVIFYSSWIFFDGAVRALRARTLDMMVLVAVAIGAGWLYSLVVSLTGGGEMPGPAKQAS
jgi:Cu2+-exporting ATPase